MLNSIPARRPHERGPIDGVRALENSMRLRSVGREPGRLWVGPGVRGPVCYLSRHRGAMEGGQRTWISPSLREHPYGPCESVWEGPRPPAFPARPAAGSR
jgi:hypothetical protein